MSMFNQLQGFPHFAHSANGNLLEGDGSANAAAASVAAFLAASSAPINLSSSPNKVRREVCFELFSNDLNSLVA